MYWSNNQCTLMTALDLCNEAKPYGVWDGTQCKCLAGKTWIDNVGCYPSTIRALDDNYNNNKDIIVSFVVGGLVLSAIIYRKALIKKMKKMI